MAVAPIFAWELSLGLYLLFKGFTPPVPAGATAALFAHPDEGPS